MKSLRRNLMRGTLAATCGRLSHTPANAQSLSPMEARQIAEDAYIYGYSLITTEVPPAKTIPIVFVQITDPVAQDSSRAWRSPAATSPGLLASNSRSEPGGSTCSSSYAGSRPRRRHTQSAGSLLRALQSAVAAAGPAVGVEVTAAPVRDTGEIESAIEQIARKPNGGIIVPPDDFLQTHSKLITDLASRIGCRRCTEASATCRTAA